MLTLYLLPPHRQEWKVTDGAFWSSAAVAGERVDDAIIPVDILLVIGVLKIINFYVYRVDCDLINPSANNR